ncbi:flippase [Halopiger djelfimassiliensis]|uniref:flippase n=1 Tax=Halopiger djelfimassiliensis TaxID=1293047 RepID=UPI00067767C6|nr:flippase [Halopiger djelfimassiliensis]
MKLGQKSIIHFLSKILASALGFIATVYIARLLGAEALGIYSVALAVVSWLGVVGSMGITAAVKKRVSELEEPSAYALAGVLIMASLFAILATGVLLLRDYVNSYVGFPAAGFIVVMLAVSLGFNLITAILNGQHLVHISGLFAPIKTGTRAGLQIGALFLSLELVGLFSGYIAGYLLVIVLGSVIIVRNFERFTIPKKYHFRRILSYGKFSWLGGLQSRAFNWVDIVVLRFFVNSSLIGFYTAAWNIAMFLILFGTSLSQTLFPEMSKISAQQDLESVSDLFTTALTYAGLFLIPGLVGGTILGGRILRIYGNDFAQARIVLSILILAALIQAYQNQFTNTLNATDHPELAFRVNAIFIVTNVFLNVILIYLYGWIGAAVATAGSVAVSLCMAHYYLSTLMDLRIPVKKISIQWLAAAVMGGFILVGNQVENTYLNIQPDAVAVLGLVGFGATTYFVTLFVLSAQFRTTVTQNISINI